MRHIPCSWEKEYTFQPDIRSAKDDWKASTKASYMYPPRSSTADAKRNSARFIQQSTLGLTSHRHPVGLPKRPTTSTLMTRLGGTSRPGTALPVANDSRIGSRRGPPVAEEPPSSLANTYHVNKSTYRSSTTTSSLPPSAQTIPASFRPHTSTGSGGSGSAVAKGRVGSYTFDDGDRGEGPSDSFYSVVPEDGRENWRGTSGVASTLIREHHAAAPLESRERMYRESVRDRRNTHLRSGVVEPEWERQRMIMDLVGAKSADQLIEEGYDPRYRPPGGLLDVRRKRPVLSGRDRSALTYQLFPETYKSNRREVGGKVVSSSSNGDDRDGERQRRRGQSASYTTSHMLDDEEERAWTKDKRAFPHAHGRALVEDDRLSEGLTRLRLNSSTRNGKAYHDDGDNQPPTSYAADRAGLYSIPPFSSAEEAFRAIESRYRGGRGSVDLDVHQQPYSAPPEVSVFHGRNGPVLVSESSLPLSSYTNTSGGVADSWAPADNKSNRRAEPVLSPPRSFANDIGLGRDSYHHANEFSRSSSSGPPHWVERTPPPPLRTATASRTYGASFSSADEGQHMSSRHFLSSSLFRAARHRDAIRVIGGKNGPIVVEDDEDAMYGNSGAAEEADTFHDDREVYVLRDPRVGGSSKGTRGEDTIHGGGSYGDVDGGDSDEKEVFIRLSPQEVREAQRQLESSARTTKKEEVYEPYYPHSTRL